MSPIVDGDICYKKELSLHVDYNYLSFLKQTFLV